MMVWIVGSLIENLGQFSDVVLRHLQSFHFGQGPIPELGKNSTQPLKGRVQAGHPFSFSRICCQPPLGSDLRGDWFLRPRGLFI